MDEGEVFDLNSISDYELLSNEDGTVLIQDNCVVIKHKQTAEIKMLPLSDEVLQALGLALVLEDQDMKQDHTGVQIHVEESADGESEQGSVLQEFMMERIEDPEESIPATMVKAKQEQEKSQTDDDEQESQHEGEQDDQQPATGFTTIVFTDDEDGDMEKSQEEGMNADETSGQGRDKQVLLWTQDMVSSLLDLYEEVQDRFLQTRNYKPIWQEIYNRMCEEYPSLRQWSEAHVASKWAGLRRTYRGAALYLQENLHTTKWVHFDRMKRIMEKNGADTESESLSEYRSKPDWNANGNDRRKESPSALSWKRKWTLLALDAYAAHRANGDRGALLWSNVRDQVISSEPDFEAVTVDQLKRKLFNLKRMYRVYKSRPQLERSGEFKDKALYERIVKIFDKEGSDEETDQTDPSETPEQHWTPAQTHHLLDLCANAGGAKSEIIEEVSERMRLRFGGEGDFSAAKCQQKLGSLRHTFNGIIERKPPSAWKTVTWPYFEKSLKIFHRPLEIWSRANTLLLLELYARVRRYLDESGARFWAELADKMRQQKPGLNVTPRKCEVKMQALFAKYRAALSRDPELGQETWPLFKKMDSIFGLSSRDQWPIQAQQQMLTLYQQRIHLLEGGASTQAVFDDIATIMAKMFPKMAFSGEICQRRLHELKEKYVSLSQDARAAATWPLYTRMSEIFSTHLWSKANVHHLLDAYLSSVGTSGAGGGAAWARIASLFTLRTPAGAVNAHQARAEFNVLKARYNTLKNGDPAALKAWPFYEKMKKIMNKQGQKPQTYQTIVTNVGRIKLELLEQNPPQEFHNSRDEVQQALEALHSSEASKQDHTQDAESDDSRDSIAERLEELLVERPAKRTRTESPEPSAQDEQEEEEETTPTRISTRSVQQKVEWSEEEVLHLLKAYSDLRGGGSSASRTWTAVYKVIKGQLTGKKTAGHCAEKINQLRLKYKAMEKANISNDDEISEAVYQKMKLLFESSSKPKENGTPSSPSKEEGNNELMQKMLRTLQARNELQQQRTDAAKKYYEEKTKMEQEKLEVLKRIDQKLTQLMESGESSTKVLIETLEACARE